MERVNWKPLLGVHLAVFVPLVAIAAVFGGYPAAAGGSMAFVLVFGLNRIFWGE